MADNPAEDGHAGAPYPGLRYYAANQNQYFAAREDDVSDCYHEFNKSKILILHGTTGCGKSSFLRAGLKPYLEKYALGHNLDAKEDGGDLQVIRSGSDPLCALARHVYGKIEECTAMLRANPEAEAYGGRIGSEVFDILDRSPTYEEFERGILQDPGRLIDELADFEMALQEPPAIVIDQAEEVFTLNLKVEVENAETGKAELRELSAREMERRTDNYFVFLGQVAQTELRTKFIISLRTEYKGQFDDRLAPYSSEVRAEIRGFHLPDLSRKGMIDAILRPTLGPKADPHFSFAPDVAARIVDRLIEKIPAGGRLPVLQVACLRLWLRARQKRAFQQHAAGEGAVIHYDGVMTNLDVDLLGPFDCQIRDYLRDQLRIMVRSYAQSEPRPAEDGTAISSDGGLDVGRQADKWMAFFRQLLVDVQADGRATTKKLSHEELVHQLETRNEKGFAKVGPSDLSPEKVFESKVRSELDWLARDEVGVLRKQVGADGTYWMLGHDSIGLVLERWHQTFGESMQAMMMDMSMEAQARGAIDGALFADRQRPPERTVYVPRDLLWDRYLIQFAVEKGFAQRLGIKFETPDALLALPERAETGINWQTLLARMEAARNNEAGHPVLFICERNNILPDQTDLRKWIDVAIADEFAGNALIGPPIFDEEGDVIETLASLGYSEDAQRLEGYTVRLRALFNYIKESGSKIIYYDDSSIGALQLAAQLAGFPAGFVDDLLADDSEAKSELIPYTSRDFLFEWMWQENSKTDGKHNLTFIIGSDYGRAVAEQTGFKTYFSRKELLFMRQAQERAAVKAGTRTPDSQPASDLPTTTTHAVWNLGYADGAPRDLELEYRLASLAFFMSEYVRTHADEFVTFLYNIHDELCLKNDGFPISQEIIRNVWKDCFNLYHFEGYSKLFYKKGTLQYFWAEDHPEYAAFNSRTIYFRMQDMRSRCIQFFKEFEERRSMATGGDREALRYADLAWKNYEIFNFFDAQQQIERALERLDNYQRMDASGRAVRAN